jgi:16S rRNA (uracil1498-N3)-methyltransferase
MTTSSGIPENRIPRIFFEARTELSCEVLHPISEENWHHLIRVLRLNVGDAIIAVERKTGKEYWAELSGTNGSIRITRPYESGRPLAPCTIQLAIALIKAPRMELALEKCTEIGVDHFHLFQAERSVVRLRETSERVTRFEKVVEAAAKQSNRRVMPKVSLYLTLNQYLTGIGRDPTPITLFGSLHPTAVTFRSLNLFEATSHLKPVHLVIGPEGDLTEDEDQALRTAHFQPVSLGPSILRTETAAIVGAAAAMLLWG